MSLSVGIIIPNIWKNNKNVPSHQPDKNDEQGRDHPGVRRGGISDVFFNFDTTSNKDHGMTGFCRSPWQQAQRSLPLAILKSL